MIEFKKYCPNCGWTGHFINESVGGSVCNGKKVYGNDIFGKAIHELPELPDGDLTDWFPKWPWDHINIEHINVLGDYNVWLHIICKKCRWDGDGKDLLSDNEIKNIKRTELIDKILC